MNKFLSIVLTVLALGLGAVIWGQRRDLAALESELKALAADRAAQAGADRAEIEKLHAQIATYREEADALHKKNASLASAAPADAAAANAPAPVGGGNPQVKMMQAMAKMFTDPEMKKSMKAQQAMGVRMMYGDLFKQLGLSPQDAEQLADILAERQMEMSAAAMSAMGADGKLNPDMAAKTQEATKHYDEQLKATLGDANYQKLQNYEKSMGDRFMMQQYDGQFAAAGTPLEPRQREALLGIMQDERLHLPESPFNQTGGNPQAQFDALKDDGAMDKYFAQQEEMNRRVLERARQTLSADQVAALQKAQQQMLEMMRGQMKMSRELLGK